MKPYACLLAAGALLAAPVLAVDFTAEEQALCKAQGGCALITHQQFDRVAAELYERGLKACRNAT